MRPKIASKQRIALIMAAFLLFTTVFSCFLCPSQPASAAESDTKFEETNVLDDLRSVEGFDLEQYPYQREGTPELYVINVVEYCYSYYANLRENYGLYLYVYNPYALNLDTNNYTNRVQIAVKYDSDIVTEDSRPMDYEKFALQLCSVSTEPNTARLFYKFKVVDHKSNWDGKTIAERVDSNARRYDISGIELIQKGHSTAEEYPLTGKYSLNGNFDSYGSFTFTGYAKGYGPDQNAESTLNCKIQKLETVQLDVKHTFYRTETSSKGSNFQNQIDTVYFSVPKRLFDDYGRLQRIKAEWYEYKTKPIIVTNNKDFFKKANSLIGVHNNDNPCCAWYGLEYSSTMDWTCDWAWVGANEHGKYKGSPDKLTDTLYYIFPTKDWCDISEYDPYAEDVEGQGGVSSNRLYEYIKSYNKTIEKGYLPIKNGKISADLFEDDIDEARKSDNERGKVQKGYSYYDFDADLDLQSWLGWSDVDHSFWDNWHDFGFWNAIFDNIPEETGRTVAPIQVIKPESPELVPLDPLLSNNLLINLKDATNFRMECNDAFTVDRENDEEKYVVLFRFAVTDYLSALAGISTTGMGDGNESRQEAYLAQETCFFDFDVIQLSFVKDEKWTVIPAVSNPIDIVNDITTPTHVSDKDDGGWPWWVWALIVIAIVIVLFVLFPKLPVYLGKAIVWVVTLPFKLIGGAFAQIMKPFQKPPTDTEKAAKKKAGKSKKSSPRKENSDKKDDA